MSYPMDLDEYSDEMIRREAAKRAELRAQGHCTYCRQSSSAPSCRFPERHAAAVRPAVPPSDDVKPYTTLAEFDEALAAFPIRLTKHVLADSSVLVLDRLLATARAGLADTERLDWLDERSVPVGKSTWPNWSFHPATGYSLQLESYGPRFHGKTLRDAIDAAKGSTTSSGREARAGLADTERERWCGEVNATIQFHKVHSEQRVTVRSSGGAQYAERDTLNEAIDAAKGSTKSSGQRDDDSPPSPPLFQAGIR